MKAKELTYKETSRLICRDLEKIIKKYHLDMDQVIDHFSIFLAKRVIEKSEDRLVDSSNFVHSFSRYVMALRLDEKSGVKSGL